MINAIEPDFTDLPGLRVKPWSFRLQPSTRDLQVDVSIVTPYYNAGLFFKETLQSVFRQTLQNWEWIIVDDGSTDAESVARLAEFGLIDSRIKVVRRVNGGTAAARNTGFKNSKGRYICLLDHDDMLESTYLEKCVWFLDSNTGFSFCNSYNVIFGDQQFLWEQGYERGKEYLKANSAPPIAVVRYSAFAEVGGFDETIDYLYEDWDFWLALANKGHWGYTIQEYLQWYRKLGGGRYEQIIQSGYDNADFAKAMQEKYPDLHTRFPTPLRRAPEPYESIESESLVNNALEPNRKGRRIMFIIPWMVVGGADRVNLELIEGLVGRGHEVTVCATLSARHVCEYKYTELTEDVFVLPNFLREIDYPRFITYLISSRKIDTVVLSGSTIGYQLLPYLRSASPNTVFVDINHVEELDWINGGHPRFGVGYQDVLDMNIVTTAHLSGWMRSRGADPGRVRVMYTGVRPPGLERTISNRVIVRSRLGIDKELPLVVFGGRMTKQKRPELLAEIFKAAVEAGLVFHALVIGDGELKADFESLLDMYELRSHVTTLGAVPHEQWLDALIASDILLMPSLYEGISISLLESMAAGVVPVVSDVGGHSEVLDVNTGFLITSGDKNVADYVEALKKLINNPTVLNSFSIACRQRIAERFSWENTIDEFEASINSSHNHIGGRVCQLTPAFGLEMVSLALENMRLNELVSRTLEARTLEARPPDQTDSIVKKTEVDSGLRFIVVKIWTKIGRMLYGKPVMKKFDLLR